MEHMLDLRSFAAEDIYALDDNFRGSDPGGVELGFTNYYMTRDGRPFFGVSGELHFSRMDPGRWEDELIKLRMAGVNVVSTYVFWNHHEETEGEFDFTGRRALRRFLELCAKQCLYVILRVGPFDHGEVRNGGLPDWLYGKPFEVRTTNEGFMSLVKRLYTAIGQQAEGMMYRDGGPVIGVQLDNEYMHSAAPWEMTTGTSNEWCFIGGEGEEYLLRLREIAAECGLAPVFYTCTGWGGAATPSSMLPLWGGYAYRPWIFYSHKGEHPSTEEYVYQDFHDDAVTCTNDFHPTYPPQSRPYACCEMGGGMMCSYYYRFRLPYKSVDAMANIKLGSGCNFLGYYMFHGGSNPLGKNGGYLNEGQVSKISYDYQAALGEFGQVRESYRRLKTIHYFLGAFGAELCATETVLPDGASQIDPKDKETLRYAVRTDGRSGFLFLNNFQDHETMPDRADKVTLRLKDGDVSFDIGLSGDENAILPFRLRLGEIELISATAQPVAVLRRDGRETYVFMRPDGMDGSFRFEDGAEVSATGGSHFRLGKDADIAEFTVKKGGDEIVVLVMSRALSDKMFIISENALIFTDGAVLEDENGVRVETMDAETELLTYPKDLLSRDPTAEKLPFDGPLGRCRYRVRERDIVPSVTETAPGRYQVALPHGFMEGVKDVLLRIDYSGDIGSAFLHNRLVSDNFCNGAAWEIGLRELSEELDAEPLTIYIAPLRKNVRVNVESAMAARLEEVGEIVQTLSGVRAAAVYELKPVLEKK